MSLAAAGCAESGEFFEPDTHGSLFDANIFGDLVPDAPGDKVGFGKPCSDSLHCESNICLKSCLGNRCSKKCSKGTKSCGAGYGCIGVNGVIEPGVVDFVCVQICEAGAPDAAPPDAIVPDAAVPDAAVPDAAVPDNALPDLGCPGGATRPCYTGPPKTKGVGICASGSQKCTAGKWGACTGSVTPAAKEACNNKDDDCDGSTDEGLLATCYSGPESTLGVGLCKAGKQACSGGKYGACKGQVTPAKEVCNNKDNDCEGFTDDEYYGDTNTCGFGVCQRTGDPD